MVSLLSLKVVKSVERSKNGSCNGRRSDVEHLLTNLRYWVLKMLLEHGAKERKRV